MYAYIKGKIESKLRNGFILENNGIGYRIFSPLSTLDKLEINNDTKIFTHLIVREDLMALYGFLTPEEIRIFELLISVSGIGPKVATAILSALSPSKFSLAVITGDVVVLKSVPGIGLKTAQRIILELKDRMKTEEAIENNDFKVEGTNGKKAEAISALQVLGYSANDAMKALASIDSEKCELEEIIKQALKSLARL